MEAFGDTTPNNSGEQITVFHAVEVDCNGDWLHSVLSCNEVVPAFSIKNDIASDGITSVTLLFIALLRKEILLVTL